MQSLSNLSAIANHYDAFLLDLWGVIHDGTHLYPGVHETLTQLRQANKKIIMLSNAPRRAHKIEAVLTQLGIDPSLYDLALSSGEAGYQWLKGEVDEKNTTPHLHISTSSHPFYYYIGPSKDADVLDGIDYKRVDDLKDADFLLNVGFGSEAQTTEDWMPLLRAARALKLPMLCLNPDLEVVKITGEHFPCAGVIAHAYQNMSGKVVWFGKPYPAVYEMCMKALNIPSPLEGEGGERSESGEGISFNKTTPLPNPPPQGGRGKVLAIGDSLETDIPGAINFGIDSMLITGGILKKNTPQEIEDICKELDLKPDYIMPGLKW